MNREEHLKKLLALKVRHQRQLDDVLDTVRQMNENMTKEIIQKIDIISNKIKNELEENN